MRIGIPVKRDNFRHDLSVFNNPSNRSMLSAGCVIEL